MLSVVCVCALRQATCRDLECCPHHRGWDKYMDDHSKSFKEKHAARAAVRAQERGRKDHLPKAGRCMYVQRSSYEEGRGRGKFGEHRGVFKWFKCMRRASERLPAHKDNWRAYVQRKQAERRAKGLPDPAGLGTPGVEAPKSGLNRINRLRRDD